MDCRTILPHPPKRVLDAVFLYMPAVLKQRKYVSFSGVYTTQTISKYHVQITCLSEWTEGDMKEMKRAIVSTTCDSKHTYKYGVGMMTCC